MWQVRQGLFWRNVPNWNAAEVLHSDLSKTQRWMLEAAYIQTEDATNISTGFFKLHKVVAQKIKEEGITRRRIT